MVTVGVVDEVLGSVREIARRQLPPGKSVLDADESLAGLGFDSLKLVGFVVELERDLDITFPADLFDASTFRSLRTVADAIRSLTAEPA